MKRIIFSIFLLTFLIACNKTIEKKEIALGLPVFYNEQLLLSAGSGHINYKCWDNPDLAGKNKDIKNTVFESCIYWIDECSENCGGYLFSNNCFNRICLKSVALREKQKYFTLKIAKCPSYNNSDFLFVGVGDNLEEFWNGEDNFTRYFYRPIECFALDYSGDCKNTYADSATVWKNCSITYPNTSLFREVLQYGGFTR